MMSSLTQAQNALHEHRFEEAIEHYQALIIQDPSNASLYLELSSCLLGLGQLEEALVMTKQAQQYASSSFQIHCQRQMANIYSLQKRYEASEELFLHILAHAPQDLDTYIGLSGQYLKTGQATQAIELLKRIEITGKSNWRWIMNMGFALFNHRQADEAIDLTIAFCQEHGPQAELISNALMFCSYTQSNVTQLNYLQEQLAKIFPTYDPSPINQDHVKTSPNLKIGFLSADFCLHPVGQFLDAFLGSLKTLGPQIYLYANMNTEDALTEKLRTQANSFRFIQGLSTKEAVQLIQKDNLDILIDLSGHTAGNRLDIIREHPAQITASYLGYPDSCYLPSMDYLITDLEHVPLIEQTQYSEQVVYLKESRLCFKPPTVAPDIFPAPIHLNGYITLGSFANPAKISKNCAIAWGEILQAIPSARLRLQHKQWDDDSLQNELLEFWLKMDIPPGRIEFHGHGSYMQYLKAHKHIDVILDTQPFTGGTTTCESLWMGVPVLTQAGRLASSRQSSSILKSIDEPNWIAKSNQEMIYILDKVSKCPRDLDDFKTTIRSKIKKSSLGNSDLFAKYFLETLNQIKQHKSSK